MTNSFLTPYAHGNLVTLTRARNLFWVLVPFLVVLVVVGGLTLFTTEPGIAVISLVLAAGLVVALVSLRAGRYRTAANITLAFFLLAATAASLATRTGSVEDDVIRVMAFFCLGLTMTSFFGYSSLQGAAMTVTGMLTMAVTFFVAVPADFLTQTIATVNQRANPGAFAVLFVLAGTVAAFSLRQNRQILAKTMQAQAATDEGFQEISRTFEETREGLGINQRLTEIGGLLAQETQAIEHAVEGLGTQADNLQNQTQLAAQTSQDLDGIQAALQTEMDDQARAVQQTSSALEQIDANIQSITASARTKKQSLDSVTTQARGGEARLREMAGAFVHMQKTAQDILSVVQVIEDISGRTNLLAMNASIEAAHAGDSGRGFAVVASEIRKLAEETSRNSKAIRETLDRNLEQVGTAVKASSASQELLRSLVQAFFEIQALLDEQLGGMEELALGTGQILESVGNLRSGAGTVQESASAVREAVAKNHLHSESIRTSTQSLRDGIVALKNVSLAIGQGIETLQQVGGANVEYLHRLTSTLSAVRTAMETKKEGLR